MMGSRTRTNGDECDAFSRQSRRIITWRRGELHKIKHRFWRAVRIKAKRETAERMRSAGD